MADKTYANQGDGTIIKNFKDMGDGTWAEVVAVTVTGTADQEVVGNVAAGAADSGNPVKIGGRASSLGTLPTAVAAGDRVNAFFDANGRQGVFVGSSEGSGTGTDGDTRTVGAYEQDGISARPLRVAPWLFNGATMDRMRGTVASTHVGNHVASLTATPTLDTSAYASGDSLHTSVLSFASAVAWTAGTGRIIKMIVIDADLQSAAGELWLFSATVTPATANAAHSISDADAALCVGVIPFGAYYASALNSVSVNASIDLPISCAATTLFGILVTRGTPTYTASGLTVKLFVAQD